MHAVTFDLDGTLYDLRPQRLRALPRLLRHPRVIQAWRRHMEGMRGERHTDLAAEVERRIAEDLNLPVERVRQALERTIHSAWPQSFHPGTPFPGVREVLDALDEQGLPRAIVSDHPGQAKLEAMNLAAGWCAVVDCSSLGALKPLPDGLNVAAEALGVPPADIVHVGDRDDCDGGMARAAGAQLLLRGVDWSHWSDLSTALGLAQG